MRGSNSRSGELFSYVAIGDRIRRDHPFRTIKGLVDAAHNLARPPKLLAETA